MDPKPSRTHLLFVDPAVVRVLIYVDGPASFGAQDFGLSTFLAALADAGYPWARFEVTRAHRQVDPLGAADLEGVRLVDVKGHAWVNPADYDEIWLFGLEATHEPLGHQELAALARAMEDGVGVFATGDHEDLGYAMCGEVPRVRSMRRWRFPGDDQHPGAPPVAAASRNDTLSAGHDGVYAFDDQSDDIPQTVDIRWYISNFFGGVGRARYPHPVLCGRRGAIRTLPDHPHEGQCEVPLDLGAGNPFLKDAAGVPLAEYPGGVVPEVIATSRVAEGITFDGRTGHKEPTRAHTFGAIAVWDGHGADDHPRGRVAVDATWHHFFDVNLVGEVDPMTGDRVGAGFLASEEGEAVLADLMEYWRNLAVWLATPARQRDMAARAIWQSRSHGLLAEVLHTPSIVRRSDYANLAYVGSYARDALGRTTSRCQVAGFLWRLFEVLPPGLLADDALLALVAPPWEPRFRHKQFPAALDPTEVQNVLLGAIVVVLARKLPRADAEGARTFLAGYHWMVAEALALGLERLHEEVVRQAKAKLYVAEHLERAVKALAEAAKQ